jgi:hypothetical protein
MKNGSVNHECQSIDREFEVVINKCMNKSFVCNLFLRSRVIWIVQFGDLDPYIHRKRVNDGIIHIILLLNSPSFF